MLKKSARLRKQKDFERVLQNGKTTHGQTVVIKYIPNQDVTTRFGIIVSKKVSKKATKRNKLKRQIREVIQKLDNPFQNYDVIVIVRAVCVEKSFQEIKKDLEIVLKKAIF